MDRVVLDTNVVVSALIGKGAPKRILKLIFGRTTIVCLSEATFAEYVEVLSRPKFTRYPAFVEAATATLQMLNALAIFVTPARQLTVCTDPGDNKFLELALEAEAGHLITGNKRHFPLGPFEGIRIVSPTEFLKSRR